MQREEHRHWRWKGRNKKVKGNTRENSMKFHRKSTGFDVPMKISLQIFDCKPNESGTQISMKFQHQYGHVTYLGEGSVTTLIGDATADSSDDFTTDQSGYLRSIDV